MISCRVLGPIEIAVDGGPAPAELLWRKNLALLVYLARSPKRTRSRDHLVGMLWGDKPESAARHSLNEAVRVLRKYAGEGALETEAGQIRLSADSVGLDVDTFEDLCGRQDWQAAVELLAGEFMEGFNVPGCSEFEDWLYGERVAWRDRSVDALVSQAGRLLNAGVVRDAARAARRALKFDPTSELAAQAAMRSLAIAGDRAAALELYESFARRLEDEFGLEPEAGIQALAERVRQERAWLVPAGLAWGTATGAESRRAPLLGRATELGRLLDAWAAGSGGRRATLAMIEGDPGTGRTRLAEELMARLRLEGAAAAAARAVEADVEEAWSTVLALARGLPAELIDPERAPRAALAALAARLPEWASRVGSAESGDSPGRALTEVLRVAASRQTVFLFVDDAQWSDRESLLSLDGLLRDLAGLPLFLLLASAPHPQRTELEELRSRIGQDVPGVNVKLGPLSGAALRELARWALPAYDSVELDRVTRRVATDSAGLPLLAVELLHAVALGLDLKATGGAWPEPYRTLDQTLPSELPDAVVAAVRVGFRRLSRAAQSALSAASVIGDRVDRATLKLATGLESEELAAALDELEWQRWITADSRGYTFVARIVRDVVARDMLTSGQRQRIIETVRGP
ncbi:MAG: AAA family ATPase [Gemmatimonadota bacterium]|nr:MAG: AAA family ATPase [Gemmatimonadota bacterium]